MLDEGVGFKKINQEQKIFLHCSADPAMVGELVAKAAFALGILPFEGELNTGLAITTSAPGWLDISRLVPCGELPSRWALNFTNGAEALRETFSVAVVVAGDLDFLCFFLEASREVEVGLISEGMETELLLRVTSSSLNFRDDREVRSGVRGSGFSIFAAMAE